VILGVAVVFPVVITFCVDSPGKANSYRRCAPVNNVPDPRAGTLLVIIIMIIITIIERFNAILIG